MVKCAAHPNSDNRALNGGPQMVGVSRALSGEGVRRSRASTLKFGRSHPGDVVRRVRASVARGRRGWRYDDVHVRVIQ